MGAGEYWGRWFVEPDRVHIQGTKREGRVRDVPLVLTPAVPSMHRRTFEDKVRDRVPAITVYDLRRTYANWLEAAGVPVLAIDADMVDARHWDHDRMVGMVAEFLTQRVLA